MTDPFSSAHSPQAQEALLALRKRAEQRHVGTAAVGTEPPPDVYRVVEELQIHQIELEMQYEALLSAQAETDHLRVRFTDLFDLAPVGYVLLDILGVMQELNHRASHVLGASRQRLQGRRFLLFVAPTSRDRFLRFMIDVLACDRTMTCEVEIQRENGDFSTVRLYGLTVPDPNGTRLCRLALIDLTTERQQQSELHAREDCLRILFDHHPEGMVLLHNNLIIACNRAALDQLGAREENQMLGQHAAAFSPERQPNGRLSHELAEEALATALRTGGHTFEWVRLRLPDEEECWQEITLLPVTINNQPMVYGIWRDVTARRREQQRRLVAEDLLHLIVATARSGVWTWLPATDELLWDERAQQLCGYPTSDEPATLEHFLNALVPGDREAAEATLRQGLETSAVALDCRVARSDGSTTNLTLLARTLRDEQGWPTALTGLFGEVSR